LRSGRDGAREISEADLFLRLRGREIAGKIHEFAQQRREFVDVVEYIGNDFTALGLG
jgi:hypothetical protein